MRPIDRELAAAGLPTLRRAAWIEVDTDQLTRNALALTDRVAPLDLGAVVKADGYGHGLEVAARCAVRGGATWLCVATLGEALRLRVDGYQGRILVLYPLPASQSAAAREEGIDVTVSTLRDVAALNGAEGLAVHLEVDTGMTRGGARPDEVVDLARRVGGSAARLVGVWTHLAAPEDPGATTRQLELFGAATASLQEMGLEVRHAAASGGILAADLSGQDLVRAGLVFYGHHPGAGGDLPPGLAPALQIKAHPVRVATVETGTGVGYSSTWRAERTSQVATLPIGYADGWSRSLSPGAEVVADGRRCPLVGRISSDALSVDVTDVGGVDEETEISLMGGGSDETITAEEVADLRGTISWEVLQQLGARLPRVYRAGGEVAGVRLESTRRVVYTRAGVLSYLST